jgi:hypothetical protein
MERTASIFSVAEEAKQEAICKHSQGSKISKKLGRKSAKVFLGGNFGHLFFRISLDFPC